MHCRDLIWFLGDAFGQDFTRLCSRQAKGPCNSLTGNTALFVMYPRGYFRDVIVGNSSHGQEAVKR